MRDLTIDALHGALAGLAMRQRVAADNIANIETPGFRAGRVDFESSLLRAIAARQPGTASPAVTRSMMPTRLDGNNVNLDEETVTMIDTGLRFQLVTQAMTNKYAILRQAIRG